jgi:fumarate hydratase class II
MKMRKESDSAGEVELPQERYYGAQTARALDLFPKAGPRMPLSVIRAFGHQKIAAARANTDLGVLESDISELIQRAAGELREGKFDDDFPLPIWQTGSGTQTNMCANEVIANRANELAGRPLGSRAPVHPNDHVNRSQSSNDSFPSVMHIAAVLQVEELLPHLKAFEQTLEGAIAAHGDAIRIGRTHLNDAVPVTYGQNIQTWLAGVQAGRIRIESSIAASMRHRSSQSCSAENCPTSRAQCSNLTRSKASPWRLMTLWRPYRLQLKAWRFR